MGESMMFIIGKHITIGEWYVLETCSMLDLQRRGGCSAIHEEALRKFTNYTNIQVSQSVYGG
jgi:hypothetical protein